MISRHEGAEAWFVLSALPVVIIQSISLSAPESPLLTIVTLSAAISILIALATYALTRLRLRLDKDDTAMLFIESAFAFASALAFYGLLPHLIPA